tara:strand:+ start:220 stop:393 length:174 start_codon:yes stop_codon:yes gene_type:complete
MRITTEQVEEWLGTSNAFEEAVDVITTIVNGEYTVEQLQEDVFSYSCPEWCCNGTCE